MCTRQLQFVHESDVRNERWCGQHSSPVSVQSNTKSLKKAIKNQPESKHVTKVPGTAQRASSRLQCHNSVDVWHSCSSFSCPTRHLVRRELWWPLSIIMSEKTVIEGSTGKKISQSDHISSLTWKIFSKKNVMISNRMHDDT